MPRDLYKLFPGMAITPINRDKGDMSLAPLLDVTIGGDTVRVDMSKPRITQERQARLHGTIAELRIALDTEKQLKALQDVEPQPGNILKRAIASIKRRLSRCK